MDEYLESTDVLDWASPTVLEQARRLSAQHPDESETARRCFEWVRDHIRHSGDYHAPVTTCRASEVLQHGTGWCFAKSHPRRSRKLRIHRKRVGDAGAFAFALNQETGRSLGASGEVANARITPQNYRSFIAP